MNTSALALLLALCADPEACFQRGLERARSGRWAEAHEYLEAGRRLAPRDRRFPLELAGVAFKQGDRAAARRHLRRALALGEDSYAEDFLGTLYFLDDNLDAALKYWNRAGRPRIEEVHVEARVDPVLLDRAFAFSPAAVLRLDELRATRARLDLARIFPRYRFELAPRADESFDLRFHAVERNGTKLERAVALARGLPYQTLYVEAYNLGRGARNAMAMLRWDPNKRRAFASFSAPPGRDPGRRYTLHFDARNERWLDGLRLDRVEAGAGFESSWGWSSAVTLAHRRFARRPLADPLYTDGLSLEYAARVARPFLELPEQRLRFESSLGARFGRLFGLSGFARSEGGLRARWHEMDARLRAGKTWGRLPFDELWQLGLERDNDLWLRGHIGTRDGKKGAAPLGRHYILSNWEVDQPIHRGFIEVRLGPFLDTGRVFGGTAGRWLWDPGVQLKLRALGGLGVTFLYGKDLRTGRDAFYAVVSR